METLLGNFVVKTSGGFRSSTGQTTYRVQLSPVRTEFAAGVNAGQLYTSTEFGPMQLESLAIRAITVEPQPHRDSLAAPSYIYIFSVITPNSVTPPVNSAYSTSHSPESCTYERTRHPFVRLLPMVIIQLIMMLMVNAAGCSLRRLSSL